MSPVTAGLMVSGGVLVLPAALALDRGGAWLIRPCRDRTSSAEVRTDVSRHRSRVIPSDNRERARTTRKPAHHPGRPSWLAWSAPLADRELHPDRRSLPAVGDAAANPRDFPFVAAVLGEFHRSAAKHLQPRRSSPVRRCWYQSFRVPLQSAAIARDARNFRSGALVGKLLQNVFAVGEPHWYAT